MKSLKSKFISYSDGIINVEKSGTYTVSWSIGLTDLNQLPYSIGIQVNGELAKQSIHSSVSMGQCVLNLEQNSKLALVLASNKILLLTADDLNSINLSVLIQKIQ